jgi:hypothetical protein
MGTDSFVLAGILPQIGSGLHVSQGSAGQVVTAFALTYAVFAPVLAAATSSASRKTLMAIAWWYSWQRILAERHRTSRLCSSHELRPRSVRRCSRRPRPQRWWRWPDRNGEVVPCRSFSAAWLSPSGRSFRATPANEPKVDQRRATHRWPSFDQ